MDDFGETLVGKKRPALYLFDLSENALNEICGISPDTHPTYPLLDEKSKGIVFAGIKAPI